MKTRSAERSRGLLYSCIGIILAVVAGLIIRFGGFSDVTQWVIIAVMLAISLPLAIATYKSFVRFRRQSE